MGVVGTPGGPGAPRRVHDGEGVGKPFSIRLPASVEARARALAAEEGISLNEAIRRGLVLYLEARRGAVVVEEAAHGTT